MDTAKEIADEISGRGLSDSEIARRCETSQATISRIRSGAVKECKSGLYSQLLILRQNLEMAQ